MFGRLYTFFPFAAEGATVSFEALAFRCDAEAIGHVERLFDEEPGVGEVVIYEGDREVFRELRPPRSSVLAAGLAVEMRIRFPRPVGRGGAYAGGCSDGGVRNSRA